MLKRSALLARGWTPGLIQAVLGRPDRVEAHGRGYQRWSEHLFAESRVRAGELDARFVAAAARRKARADRAAARTAGIPTQYASWREAAGPACEYLFSLNRFAKHRLCSAVQRVEIYALKNEWIRLLYERGYCTLSWIHRLTLAAQDCRECAGAGGDCGHCDGSGVWRPARLVEFWCFRFAVAGRTYCWHQPLGSVEFAPIAGLPPQDWAGPAGEKPVALPRRKFAHAKALLRWALDAAAEDAPATPATDAGTAEQMPLFAA